MSGKKSPEGIYARKLGITTRELKRIGGMDRDMRMTDDCRVLLMPKRKQ